MIQLMDRHSDSKSVSEIRKIDCAWDADTYYKYLQGDSCELDVKRGVNCINCEFTQ